MLLPDAFLFAFLRFPDCLSLSPVLSLMEVLHAFAGRVPICFFCGFLIALFGWGPFSPSPVFPSFGWCFPAANSLSEYIAVW